MGLAYNLGIALEHQLQTMSLNIKNKFGAKMEDYYWLLFVVVVVLYF
jgi:hypothetical protein